MFAKSSLKRVVVALFLAALLVFSLRSSTGAPSCVTILALGDILLDGTPGRRLDWWGERAFFGPIQPLLLASDLTFANLENPFADHPSLRRDKPADLTFNAPPRRLRALARAGITLVSLANNHMQDAGSAGIVQTLQVLDAEGIAHAGAGRDERQAREPALVRVAGYRLALLAYNHVYTGVPAAAGGRPGVAWADLTTIASDVRRARSELQCDAVIVSVHWGTEFDVLPTAFQYAFGRACIDAGALIVLGQHPHVVQGLEGYRGGLIAYSLGNAIFSQPGEETSESVALRIVVNHTGIQKIECVPLVIDPRFGAPRVATGEVKARVLARIRGRSMSLKFHQEGWTVLGGSLW